MTLSRVIIVGTVALVVVLAITGLFFWRMMSAPMYAVGDAASLVDTNETPPEPAAEMTQAWAVEPDVELHYQSFGEGTPVLVVHGGPAIPYSGEWQGLTGLTDRYRFLYYHQRGCGRSTRPFDRFESRNTYQNIMELESKLGLAEQIADIERIRIVLGQDKLVLIGHSFGGFIATMYAAEFPERVKKLILVAPAGLIRTPLPEADLFKLTASELSEADRQRFEELRKEYFNFAGHFKRSEAELARLHLNVGGYIQRAMGYEVPELPRDYSGALQRAGGWSAFAMYFSLGWKWDYTQHVGEIKIPALVITGEDDRLAKPGTEQYRILKSVEFVELASEEPNQQAGHIVFNEAPVAFGEAVSAFLDY